MKKTKVALLGTGFSGNIHMESYLAHVPDAEVAAIYGRNMENVQAFALRHARRAAHTAAQQAKKAISDAQSTDNAAPSTPVLYDDIDELLAKTEVDVVDICLPNYLHHSACMKAAAAGKHIIIEKPLALTLEEADEMIAECKKRGLLLMYAEELCFAPKYERVRSLVEAGAIGDIYELKQAEKHSGPHSAWFYKKETAGGGVMMDMGCHALAWFRWMNKNRPVKSVMASMKTVLHKDITDCDDNIIVVVEFENGVIGLAEDSWARHGGMDDRIEIYGTKGVSYADLFQGNSALTYSMEGYDYAAEKAALSTGWSFTMFEEAYNQGFPHELRHFIKCVREGLQPVVTGEDGRAVLEIVYAAYESARTGRKVELPFYAKVRYPIELLLGK